jgi:hypothetical protein
LSPGSYQKASASFCPYDLCSEWFLNHPNFAYLPKASPLTALLLRLSDLSKITPFPISFSPDETSKPSRKKKIASDLGIWIMVRRIGALDQRLWIC